MVCEHLTGLDYSGAELPSVGYTWCHVGLYTLIWLVRALRWITVLIANYVAKHVGHLTYIWKILEGPLISTSMFLIEWIEVYVISIRCSRRHAIVMEILLISALISLNSSNVYPITICSIFVFSICSVIF